MEPLEFCFLSETSGWKVPWVQEHFHGEETGCFPAKVLVISVALLPLGAIKW
jgi:hypothetical protein